MPRAEAGTTKAIANQMKSKGLQRLRWWCQACSRQMRDENGFKCHVASESHVRNMMTIGQDSRKAINDFSNEFQRDFVQLLRTGHGEKQINANRFYQEYIGNKEHVHMNATKWPSLTEFCKHLGREGIIKVELDEKHEERGGASALMISYIDNSPEALRRQEAIKKRERQAKGDEAVEQRTIQEQIRRAREAAGVDEDDLEDEEPSTEPVNGQQCVSLPAGEKFKLSLGTKKTEQPPSPPLTEKSETPEKDMDTAVANPSGSEVALTESNPLSQEGPPKVTAMKPISLGSTSKPKNVFAAAAKKNALKGSKKPFAPTTQKPMSEAERIMKEEIERKRHREQSGGIFKKQRIT